MSRWILRYCCVVWSVRLREVLRVLLRERELQLTADFIQKKAEEKEAERLERERGLLAAALVRRSVAACGFVACSG